MTTYLRHTFGLSLLLLANAAQAAPVSIDLYAKSGSTTLPPAATALVIGYVLSPDTTLTAPGGPVLTVNQGDIVTVTLHNGLAESSALLFQGQAMVPDLVGAAPLGGTATYSFTAGSPGTFLYGAGPLANAQHQAARGLHGALVVRPVTAGQAYDSPATAYNDEAVLVLSELDPALNGSATPASFDMRNYAPKYFLINGKAYPNTDPIPTTAGNKVLLRYVNAGIQHHSMTLLGTHQTVVAKDGSPLTYPGQRVAETIAPGTTMDAIATMPAAATGRFALFDGSLDLFNNRAAGFGGMLTFLSVTGGTPTPAGPAVTALALSGNLLTATIAAGAGRTVTAAQYWVDSGTPTAMTPSWTATLPTQPAGSHTISVRGQDDLGNWGAARSINLSVDTTGPATSGLTLTPNPSNGAVSVALHATGNDSAAGGSNIAAAEFFIGAVGANGTGTSMAVNVVSPIASLDATIAAPVTGGVVSVHSQDALGNWGAFATITLLVDGIGPGTSNVVATPNPLNGTTGLNLNTPAVRVTATFGLTTDAGSSIAAGEGFIGTVGPNGTGFPFIPSDGQFNGMPETGYADIPLTTINQLGPGSHTIYVHGKDAAGNWGPNATTTLVLDMTAPALTSITLNPSTMVFGTAGTLLTVSATDIGTSVTGGQYWIDGTATPPANATSFTGTAPTINTSALAAGAHVVYARAQDAASNWSTVSSASLTVIRAVNDTRTINANNNATQNNDAATAPGLLANDLPVGLAGRTASLVSAPGRISGTGAGTIAVTCPASLGTAATPAINGNTVCTNGAYRVTLTGVPSGNAGNNGVRRISKLGTFTFTYRETVNGVSSQATVTITVN